MAFADSVFVGTLERTPVVIRDIQGGMLLFDTAGHPATPVEVSKISRIAVDNDGVLTAAEEAFSIGKFDDAADAYLRSIRTTNKPWVKTWSALRLLDAANHTGRFDAANTAYIITLLNDPASAAKHRPAMPDAKSTYLDSAVAEVDAALKTPSLSTDQRRALLGYLVDLQAARNDPAGGDQAYEELAKLPNADVDDPNIRRVMAERKLTVASRALDAKHYQDAIDQVMSNRASFTEPNQQSEALWIVAEARRATAGNDPDALKDAALAYMRVVLAGKDSPAAAARVAQSLAQAAELCERAGDDAGALQLDEQLLAQYPSDPAASTARQNVQRLAKSKSR